MLYRAFDGFCVRVYHTEITCEFCGLEWGESIQDGDLYMACGAHDMAMALCIVNEKVNMGFDCEVWTCDNYLCERDMLLDRNACKDLV